MRGFLPRPDRNLLVRARKVGVPLPEAPLNLLVVASPQGRKVVHRDVPWVCVEDGEVLATSITLNELWDGGYVRCSTCMTRRYGYGPLTDILWDVSCALGAHDGVHEALRRLDGALSGDGVENEVEAWALLHLLEHFTASAWGESAYLVKCWVSDLLDTVEEKIPALRSRIQDLGTESIIDYVGASGSTTWSYVVRGDRGKGFPPVAEAAAGVPDPQRFLDAVEAAFGIVPGVHAYAVPSSLVPALVEVSDGSAAECGLVDWDTHESVAEAALMFLDAASDGALLADPVNAFQAARDVVRSPERVTG